MKKNIISIALLLIAIQSFGQFNISDHLIGSYPLNGNSLDFSGNGNNLSLQNVSPTVGIENVPNSGYLHQNSNSTISRPSFNIADSISICAWIKPTDSLQSAGIFYNGFSGSNGYGIFVKKHLNSTQLGNQIVLVQGGIAETLVSQNFYMPKNQWTHLTLVKKQSTYSVYANGIRLKSGNAIFNPPNGLFSIGSPIEHINEGNPAFKGIIDNVLIVNYALDSTKISDIINNTITNIQESQNINRNTYYSIENKELIVNTNLIKEFKLHSLDGKNIP
jgi:hypothetical protein